MNRIAFFVEGQTEQIFLNRLVKEILGTQYTNIIQKQIRGGVSMPKEQITRSLSISKKPRNEVLIFDCGADNRVKSEIMENIRNLRNTGYSLIVGLRDLYPMPIEELDKLEKGLKYLPRHLRNEEDYYDIIIAIHEIEAWFMAETNHLQKVDRRLTGPFIRKHLGFDPYSEDCQSREHPAKDLSDIYRLVGKSYTKRHWQVQKLVNRLDYNYIRNQIRYDVKPLGRLIGVIEDFKDIKLKKMNYQ